MAGWALQSSSPAQHILEPKGGLVPGAHLEQQVPVRGGQAGCSQGPVPACPALQPASREIPGTGGTGGPHSVQPQCAAALPALPSNIWLLLFSCCTAAGRWNLHMIPASCCKKPWEESRVLLLLCSKDSIPCWELVLPLTSSSARHPPPGAGARLTLFLLQCLSLF